MAKCELALSLADYLYQDPLGSATVELAVEDLFPRTKVQSSVGDGNHHFSAHGKDRNHPLVASRLGEPVGLPPVGRPRRAGEVPSAPSRDRRHPLDHGELAAWGDIHRPRGILRSAVMMESLLLCKDAGEIGQRPGRTLDTAIHANCLQYPNSPNYRGMADDSEFDDSEFKANRRACYGGCLWGLLSSASSPGVRSRRFLRSLGAATTRGRACQVLFPHVDGCWCSRFLA